MDWEEKDKIREDFPEDSPSGETESEGSPYDETYRVTQLSGLYQDWFLDYASYVILERAVPHIHDGLKPVQRRILHAMKRLDDGRYNKVANIIGHTMQYHPHGDASIGDALVQMGQKELLIDTQGNWGNVLTGDGAAASRYIEARLSKFALEVVFNSKTTEWKPSYDGRNKEPVTLPVKFPLLLVQGVEGIAVGLASKILPHNFNEVIDAAIAYLKKQSFELFPDFLTGGLADFSKYNDGKRGGSVRIRARISKLDKRTLVITEIPYGKTTGNIIDSIIKANEKGKIKVKKIDDNTSEKVEILVHLVPGVSSEKTIDALYAFTDCETPVSPNACVIQDGKPRFLGVSDILRASVDRTVHLLTRELEIRREELNELLHFSSLEKIFIEKRIYRKIEECETWESVIETIGEGLKPFSGLLLREVTRDDIIRLTEIKIKRISRYDSRKADEVIKNLQAELAEVENHLENIISYAVNYFRQIRKKYGAGRNRKTEIRNFDTIEATKVAVANAKLYVNRREGFAGTALKKDEYVCDCSDIDDIIVIREDGSYLVTKVAEKLFVGKNIHYIGVFKKNDKRTIYNILYRDGKSGPVMVKRAAITGITRDREYNLTRGTENSKILYLSGNPNGEAEVVKVYLKPKPRLRQTMLELDFAGIAIKGRSARGNIFTRHSVQKVVMKEKGESTLGGRKVWFDHDVLRLNYDGRGTCLGEFSGGDRILVVTREGTFFTCSFDPSNHFEDNILLIEKFNPNKVYSAVYYDAGQEYYYVKRFSMEPAEKPLSFIGGHPESKLVSLMEVEYPRLEIQFGGKNKTREPEIIEVAEFIGVKSYRARGKRLTTFAVENIREIEPVMKTEIPPADNQENGGGADKDNEERIPEVKKPPEKDTDYAQMKLDI
ncbi:MAG: DNA gyrase/topoisomerase IV subunit A [Bacteroidales bacterium]